jgi:DNA-binding NarL/FixJ family response regulator
LASRNSPERVSIAHREDKVTVPGEEVCCQASFDGREISVLMGINEPEMSGLITEILQTHFGRDYLLRLTEASNAWTLLEQARLQRPDLFIIVLNNLHFSEETPCVPEQRIELVTGFLKHLKETYRRPVIVLSGWAGDPLIGIEVMFAAADAFLRLPFQPRALIAAVEKCLGSPPRAHSASQR